MEVNKLELNESVIDKEGNSFEIKYIGIPKKNKINEIEVRNLITKFMNQIDHYNTAKNVAFIRTILKDYDEQFLSLTYKEKSKEEHAEFAFSTLYSYEKTGIYDDSSKNYKIKYKLSDGINTNTIEYSDVSGIDKEMSWFFNKLVVLNGIKPITPSQNMKIIIEIYKLFYNENPNFSEKNINRRIQAMMSILAEFGICINNTYSLDPCDDYSNIGLYYDKEPTSLRLWQDVEDMFPVGEIKSIEDPVHLNDYYKNIIETAGEEIRNFMNNKTNIDEALTNMSKLIYMANYRLSSLNDETIEKVINNIEIEEQDAKEYTKIIKKIDSRIQKN